MTTTTTILNIFITNLRAYNEGELLGEWVELPLDAEELEETIYRICGDDEYFITDFDSDLGITCGEYDSPFMLNELAQAVEDSNDPDTLAAYLEAVDSNVEHALNEIGDCVLYAHCDTLEDLAVELVEEGSYGEIPDCLANYIDYDAIARDLKHDNYYETSYGVLYAG